MTREKALILALKIVDVCKTYGEEDRCRQCPFNAKWVLCYGRKQHSDKLESK